MRNIALFAVLLAPYTASATCYDRCELDCLWEEYKKEAQESIDDGRRAERYLTGAGDAYSAALDAAQAQLDAVIDAVNPVSLPSATDALPPIAQRVLSIFTTANNLLNGLGNVQGAGVLERMGEIAQQNSNASWARAQRALQRHRECVEQAGAPEVPSSPPPTPPGGPTLGTMGEPELLGEVAKPDPHDRREGARALATRATLTDATVRGIKQRLGVEGDTYARYWLVVALGKQGARASVALPQIVGHGSTDVPLVYESIRACGLIDATSSSCQTLFTQHEAHAEAAIRDLVVSQRRTSGGRGRR
ncbi:MAG: hypothetical protein H6734_19445 [Alphaproteobacteria bacterium]|nr:hypothetical protein [Alphaproteobacteria bacterium]